MAWVYILRCGDGTYYVGSARDLERRIEQHHVGEGAEYTRRRLPVELVWAHECEHVGQAYALEEQIQNWSRAKRAALIEGRFTDLPALSRGRTGWMKRGVTDVD
jgi:putative endonuclease